MFKIIRKIYNHNRTYKKSKEFASFEEAYQYADKYTRVTFSIYKIETEIYQDDVLVYTLDTEGNEKDLRQKEKEKVEYVIYRGSKKLFAKDNLKDAQIYAKYWSRKDRIPYSVISSDGRKEYIYEPPEKILGWYVWELGERFKTIEDAEKHIASIGNHKEFNIYKVVEGDLLNDKYIKYKTVQAL